MVAFRGINLRSGDLAEQLGLFLLQSIALVTPVPRTEDVGVDAVVALLHKYDPRRLIASKSFFVQLKSSSVDQIKFSKEQLSWLFGLELPFFIGSIDKKKNFIKLYCCHRLIDAFISRPDRDGVVIHLSTEENQDEFVPYDCIDICVGPPVIEFDITQVCDDRLVETICTVCSFHIDLYREGLEHRRVGTSPYVVWRTNELPKRVGWKSMFSSPAADQIEPIADLAMPYFIRLLDACMFAKRPEWLYELKKLVDGRLAIVEKLIKNRV
ncbi:MAG: hypothetical protein WCJ64_13155 [Rhodospirillaceae bacterium]